MLNKIRTTTVTLIAASSLAAVLVAPAASQAVTLGITPSIPIPPPVATAAARPVQVYPTSPTELNNAKCGRWGTKINEDKNAVGFSVGGKSGQEAASKVKADESKAMDDGCFIIY
jgi:hypothetical protein